MSEIDITSVSPHALESIFEAAESAGLFVAEDIYDDKGNKLLAAGHKVSRELKERLISRKLRKPLETSLGADNGVTSEELSKDALQLLHDMPMLSKLCKCAEDEAKKIASVRLEPLASLLLTVSRDDGKQGYKHTVLMMMICRMLGRRLNLDHQTMILLTQAAQAHDLGELYVDPEYLSAKRRLTPEEWKSTMVHPKIGEMLIVDHTQYPMEVARAVMEHHERADGSGYPRKLVERQISPLGRILIVGELLSGMLSKPDFPLHRALLVTRLLPGEFPAEPIGALHNMVHEAAIQLPEHTVGENNLHAVKPVIDALEGFIMRLNGFVDVTRSTVEQTVAQEALVRITRLERAVLSLGLEYCLKPDSWQGMSDDPMIHMEVDVAGREIAWRLRDISRDMVLELIRDEQEASETLSEIITEMSQISV